MRIDASVSVAGFRRGRTSLHDRARLSAIRRSRYQSPHPTIGPILFITTSAVRLPSLGSPLSATLLHPSPDPSPEWNRRAIGAFRRGGGINAGGRVPGVALRSPVRRAARNPRLRCSTPLGSFFDTIVFAIDIVHRHCMSRAEQDCLRRSSPQSAVQTARRWHVAGRKPRSSAVGAFEPGVVQSSRRRSNTTMC